MTLTVTLTLNRQFVVTRSFDAIFAVLADVPYSISHFPKLANLVDLGNNSYRWEMEKIGIDRYAMQTIYACNYRSVKEEGLVTWTPIAGVGNGIVKGSWRLRHSDAGIQLSFFTEAALTLPLPALLKFLIAPLVSNEFEGLVDGYISNLSKTFAKLPDH